MALIEKYHVVAAVKAIATDQTIKEGQFVSLNASGEVVLQSGDFKVPYGIAGDTKSTTASAMPGVASGWQNRASDYYDETKASAKMTVYHSGGEFATDQFDSNVASAAPGAILYAVNGVLATNDAHSSTVKVAILTQVDSTYPSGVPGTDINGDAALSGDDATNNKYVEIKLLI
jgi:hypothetical protein